MQLYRICFSKYIAKLVVSCQYRKGRPVVARNSNLTDSEALPPLLTPKAFEVLYPYIKDFVQFWETTTDYGNMYLVNVINVNDCVNYDESDFVRFKSSGRIMRIDKFAFHKNKIMNIELFKIPDENKTYPFVTEGLKNIIKENGLNGFRFELLSE